MGYPVSQGLYDPRNEHDACGVGFVADIKGRKAHNIIEQGLLILENLDHRGAVGADKLMGDGAGILVQIPGLITLVPGSVGFKGLHALMEQDNLAGITTMTNMVITGAALVIGTLLANSLAISRIRRSQNAKPS